MSEERRVKIVHTFDFLVPIGAELEVADDGTVKNLKSAEGTELDSSFIPAAPGATNHRIMMWEPQ